MLGSSVIIIIHMKSSVMICLPTTRLYNGDCVVERFVKKNNPDIFYANEWKVFKQEPTSTSLASTRETQLRVLPVRQPLVQDIIVESKEKVVADQTDGGIQSNDEVEFLLGRNIPGSPGPEGLKYSLLCLWLILIHHR